MFMSSLWGSMEEGCDVSRSPGRGTEGEEILKFRGGSESHGENPQDRWLRCAHKGAWVLWAGLGGWAEPLAETASARRGADVGVVRSIR